MLVSFRPKEYLRVWKRPSGRSFFARRGQPAWRLLGVRDPRFRRIARERRAVSGAR
ncbi:hypothetical protein A33K_13520 [Burkholderia humptydooensis MSMB43]|uniref:Uncharacterized protein n=1 Tax=Burkholderia humptydooensis MSMB43 TaxID=441157 RepID=A0ABN0GCR1_9BURK|nr:hypothetical protein A33K_13520 [Burkholderia humptydooensis MSMB43]